MSFSFSRYRSRDLLAPILAMSLNCVGCVFCVCVCGSIDPQRYCSFSLVHRWNWVILPTYMYAICESFCLDIIKHIFGYFLYSWIFVISILLFLFSFSHMPCEILWKVTCKDAFVLVPCDFVYLMSKIFSDKIFYSHKKVWMLMKKTMHKDDKLQIS